MHLTLKQIGIILLLGMLSSLTHAVSVNQTAPDFTLKSFSGKNMRLEEQRGKIILLNFWATWCTPCRQEIPELNKLQAKYGRLGVRIWGVSTDNNYKQAKNMASQLNVIYTVLHDRDKTVSKLYDPNTMPYTLLIDRHGKIRQIYRGYVSGYENKYAADIRKLLRE